MKLFRHPGIIGIALVILVSAGLSMIGCPTSASSNKNQTPVVDDYIISNLGTQTADNIFSVTITPKPGKSPGVTTVYYEGISPTTYTKSTTVPQEEGTYRVTFNVAAASGWNKATGLIAGNLTIIAASNPNKGTPIVTDFTITNLNQTENSVTAVIIRPNTGKSTGAITIFYNGSQSIPQNRGSYTVTFTVASTSDWYGATLTAGFPLTVSAAGSNGFPAVSDYNISNLTQTEGSVTAVIITPKAGKSEGARTIYYEGADGTTYAKSIILPTVEGSYQVTFDVAAATDWNSVSGLIAGTLIINASSGNRTPATEHYTLGNNTQTANKVTNVTITKSANASPGDYTITYVGSSSTYTTANPPQDAGVYAVTIAVAAAQSWNEAKTIYVGILSVEKDTPVIGDFIIDTRTLSQNAGTNVKAPSITPKDGKTDGTRTIYYEGISGTATESHKKGTAIPTEEGKYKVTFNVAESKNWKEAENLPVGELNLTQQKPEADHFDVGDLVQTAGSVNVIITPKDGKSQGAITIKYDNSAIVPTGVGSFRVTFDVVADSANGWLAATDLYAGILITNNNNTPAISHYDIDTNTLLQTAGKVVGITITPKNPAPNPAIGVSPGLRTIYYEGIAETSTEGYTKKTTPPQTSGSYNVTFDVAPATGWNGATGLSAGTLVVQMGVKKDSITIGWSEATNTVTITSNITNNTISSTGEVTFRVASGFYSQEWYLNGVSVNNTTDTYIFKDGKPGKDASGNVIPGKYTVSVLVSKRDPGPPEVIKLYNADVVVTVTP